MTLDNHGSIWTFDQTVPYSYPKHLDKEQMKNRFNWNNFCPRLKNIILQKETKSTFDYISYKMLGLIIFPN